jgi:HEAT repeat protein
MIRRLLRWVRGEETTEIPADAEARAAHIRELGDRLRHGTEEAALVHDSLTDESPRVRAAAAEAIGTRDVYLRELAPDPLVERLDDPSPQVRTAAAEALGSERLLAERVPAPPLVDCLEDPDRSVRLAAASVYESKTGGEELDSIYDRTLHDDVGIRAAAAKALTHAMQGAPYEMGEQQVVALVEALAETKQDRGETPDHEMAREHILDALDRGSFVAGLQFLGEAHTATILDELDAAAPAIRANAATVLGRIDREDVLDPLSDALRDDAPTVREHASRALVRAGTGSDAHIERFDDFSSGAMSSDIQADERVVRDLNGALERETHPGVVDQFLESLGRLGDPAAVDALLEYVDSDDEERRRTVVDALGEVAPVAVEPLTDRLRHDPSEEVRATAAQAFSDPGVDACDELRRAYETDDSDRVRAAAVSSMHTCQADWTVDILRDALAADSVRIRNKAVFALGELGATEATDTLRRVAETDDNPNVREEATRALEKL